VVHCSTFSGSTGLLVTWAMTSKVLVEVQHGESRQFGGGGNDQAGDGRGAVLAAVGEQGQDFH
jgi:hypothetical protein